MIQEIDLEALSEWSHLFEFDLGWFRFGLREVALALGLDQGLERSRW